MAAQAEQWFQQAVQYHRQGRMAEAEKLYRSVLEQVPGDVRALYLLGTLRAQVGDLDQAQSLLSSAVAAAPGNAGAHTNLGNVLRARGKLGEAEAAYRRALELAPDDPVTLSNLGAVIKEMGRSGEAEPFCRRAVALAPGHLDGHLNLGVVLAALGRLDEAEGCYRTVLSMHSGSVQALCNLGNVLSKKGRHEEALSCYQQALTLDPNDGRTLANLGNTCYEMGRLEEAVGYYENACRIAPDNREMQINYGLTLAMMGDDGRQRLLEQLQEDHIYQGSEEAVRMARKLAEGLYVPPDHDRGAVVRFLDEFDAEHMYPMAWWREALGRFGDPVQARDKLLRAVYCKVFGWSLPVREALERVAEFAGGRRIASYGAGSAYWEYLLSRHFGVDVAVSDIHLGHRFLPMEVRDFNTAEVDGNDVVLLSWIPNDRHVADAAMNLLGRMVPGQCLVLVGDQPDRWGNVRTCGTADLFDLLEKSFVCERQEPLVSFAYVFDGVNLYRKQP